MLLRTSSLASALLLASSVSGLKDALPFFLLSSHQLNSTSPIHSSQMLPAKSVEDAVLGSALIKSCRADVILVRQPGIAAADFHQMSNVKRRVEDVRSKSGSTYIEVPEVLGEVRLQNIEQEIGSRCGDGAVRIVNGDAGTKNVKDTDSKLAALLKEAENGKPYVVILSASNSAKEGVPPYEMDETHPELHTDLRRDLDSHERQRRQKARDENDSEQGDLPLFETYQFLSPPIFMGLSVSILLLLILYVALSAISGLEVSYMAFSKEMGPQAQKGKQQ